MKFALKYNRDNEMNLLEDNNTGNMLAQGVTTAWMSTYFYQAYIAMLPWFAVAVPLILLDLRLGRKKANIDGEPVTINKSIRMTIDKSFSYLCWIMLATTMSIAFHADFIKFFIMGVIYGLELISSISKLFYVRGMNVNEVDMIRIVCTFAWKRLTGCEDDLHDVFTELKKNRNETGSDKNSKEN